MPTYITKTFRYIYDLFHNTQPKPTPKAKPSNLELMFNEKIAKNGSRIGKYYEDSCESEMDPFDVYLYDEFDRTKYFWFASKMPGYYLFGEEVSEKIYDIQNKQKSIDNKKEPIDNDMICKQIGDFMESYLKEHNIYLEVERQCNSGNKRIDLVHEAQGSGDGGKN